MDNKNIDSNNTKVSFLMLYNLTKNIIKILFLFSILLFLFYLVGNYQNFLDKSQILILRLLSVFSIITGVLCIFGILESIFFIFTTKQKFKKIYSILFMIFVIIVCIFFIVYSTVLNQLAQGL